MAAPSKKPPQLLMQLDPLEPLPPVELPEGYAIRHFQPGDEPAWEAIIRESFGYRLEFHKHLGSQPAFNAQRVLFAVRGNEPVATATAWWLPQYGPDCGYVHMVGVAMLHAGKKLGYWVSLAALHRFAHERFRRAVLQTDDFRLAAIKTYWRLGFRPVIADNALRERWDKVTAELGLSEGR